MAIKGLLALISEHAPEAISEHEIQDLRGRKVAINGSSTIYQFFIAVRQENGELIIDDGASTSHLMGFFYRTIRMVENGIKPAYIFDGKSGNSTQGLPVQKSARRQIKVSEELYEECRKLLKLMGVPVVISPSEAVAQCAELARGGKVDGVNSDGLDALTHDSPILYRNLTSSGVKSQKISEITLKKVLEGLKLNQSQFIDLCLLLGCGYIEPIENIPPGAALELILQYGDLNPVIAHFKEQSTVEALKSMKVDEAEEGDEEAGGGSIKIPEVWPWEEVKKILGKPAVIPADEVVLEWRMPDVDGLVQYLVKEKGFTETRVRKCIKVLEESVEGQLEANP